MPVKECQDEASKNQPEPEKEQAAFGWDDEQFQGLEPMSGTLMSLTPWEPPKKKKEDDQI